MDNTFAPGHELLRQNARTGREPRGPARQTARGLRRRRLHHHPEVHARRRPASPTPCSPSGATSSSSWTRPTAPSTASRPAIGETDGRRAEGLRPGQVHARRPAQRHLHRLHRHARLAARTATRATSLASTSTSTTSSAPSRTRPPCPSTTTPATPRMKLDEAMVPAHRPRVRGGHRGRGADPHRRAARASGPQMAAIVGDPDRIELVAQDIVDHFEQRDHAMPCPARP